MMNGVAPVDAARPEDRAKLRQALSMALDADTFAIRHPGPDRGL
ncbi:MAG: hypothetical protein ACLUJG_18375 [Lawsonibacter sp.]